MLSIYTPNDQTANIEEAMAHAVNYCRHGNLPEVCETDLGFAVKTSWCREMAVENLREIMALTPPGTVNIYGIRKHGAALRYQPARAPGAIHRSSVYVDTLFTCFFQTMVELLSYILDNNTMSEERVREIVTRWTSRGLETNSGVLSDSINPLPKCLLNYDEEDIPDLVDDDFWVDDKMFGTITGIPSHWLNSIPVMSYLLYLPRLWGVFYHSPRILPTLSKLSRRKAHSPVMHSIMGKPNQRGPQAYPTWLWSIMARKMMFPSWLTPCGRECFWTFTYLIIRAVFGKTFSCIDGIPNLASALTYEENRSGFVSWCSSYKSRNETPGWVNSLITELSLNGPSSVVRFGNIASYI